jgi:hypothetical protein
METRAEEWALYYYKGAYQAIDQLPRNEHIFIVSDADYAKVKAGALGAARGLEIGNLAWYSDPSHLHVGFVLVKDRSSMQEVARLNIEKVVVETDRKAIRMAVVELEETMRKRSREEEARKERVV